MRTKNSKVICLDWIADKEEWNTLVSKDTPEGRYTIEVSVTLFDRFQRFSEDVRKFPNRHRELLNKLIDKQFEEWLSEHKRKTT